MEALADVAQPPEQLGYDECLRYGWWLTSRGLNAAALAYYRQAVAIESSGIALTSLGSCLRRLGELELAAETLQMAIRAPHGRSTSHARVSLAATLLDLGKVSDATDVVLELLAEDTENVPVLMVAARCTTQVAHAQDDSTSVHQLLMAADALRTKADQLRDTFESAQELRRYRRSLRLDEEPLFLAASIGFPARIEVFDGGPGPAERPSRSDTPSGLLRSLLGTLRRFIHLG